METMNISLPASLKKFVQERVAGGDFGNASEYIRGLLREDRERRAEQRLETLLLEGLGSGDPIEADRKYWRAKRRELTKNRRSDKAP